MQDHESSVPSVPVLPGTKDRYHGYSRPPPVQQSFSLPVTKTSIPLPSTRQPRLENSSSSETSAVTQSQLEPEKQPQRDHSSTQNLPQYAGKSTSTSAIALLYEHCPSPPNTSSFPRRLHITMLADQEAQGSFTQSEDPASAQSESVQQLDSQGVNVQSEEPVERPASAAETSETPQTSEPAQSTSENRAQDADGGKIRGESGRFVSKHNSESRGRKSCRSTGGARAKGGRKCK